MTHRLSFFFLSDKIKSKCHTKYSTIRKHSFLFFSKYYYRVK